ncbi:MAG: DUF58 domain-containing protein [Spirochaetota bacterium]
MAAPLLDEEFLRKLEKLSLLARKVRSGPSRGENISINRGASLEFSDYRLYQPGDDFRYLDWNIYSRLNRLFVKVFTAEENLTVHILIDTSRSMSFGNPSKLSYGGRLAAALGYLAVNNLDRVGVSAFAEGVEHSLPPVRRTSHAFTIFDYIASLKPSGRTDFSRTLRDYSLRTRRAGLAILITDLLDPGGYEEGLRALLYRRFDIMLIQVMDEDELEPRFKGPLRLIDGETEEETELNVEPDTVTEYQNRLAGFFGRIEEFCLDHDIEYLRTSTRIPFEDVVFSYLRRGVFVR